MTDPAPFISTQDLSDHLGKDVTSDPGAVIAVDAACQLIRDEVGQMFNQAVETIKLDGTGTDCLLLPNIPVNSAGTVIEAGGTLVLGTDYVVADSRKLIRTNASSYTTFLEGWSPSWPRGRQNIQVTYDHGWVGTAVPNSVRIVALIVAERIAVQGIAESESVARGQMITYASKALDLTPGERRILSRYRNS